MFNLHFIAQQHRCANLYARVGAAALRRVKAQLFPQHHLLQVGAAHPFFADVQDAGDGRTVSLITFLVVCLAFAVFVTLVFGALQVARNFHNDLARMPVALDECIDDQPHLVQADMNRWVGDAAKPFFGRVF